MRLLILLFMCSSPVYALDINSYVQKFKDYINDFVTPSEEVSTEEFQMPLIPKIVKSATNTKVYEKKGKVYSQGSGFNNLSNEEKRKYRMAFLTELYRQVRGSEITNKELLSGVNILEQGASREGVYRSLVLSSEYRALEAFEEVPSESAVNWVVSFGEKFLALSFKKDQVSKLNLWGIKRVIVEKSLELIDSFPEDGEDLYKWYAFLSKDMSALKFVGWKNNARKNSNLKFHYLWAKSVPLQQIKSEVIIKIHIILNKLG